MTRDGGTVGSPDEAHLEFQELLPWYVTGALDPAEQARMSAHVAACPECQGEVGRERLLEHAVASLPLAVEHSWADMRRRIAAEATVVAMEPKKRKPVVRPWVGWSMAASFGLMAGVAGVSSVTSPRPATTEGAYHTLSAAPAPDPVVGNVIVIFRPDISEADLRGVLRANHARLLDGPTAADAYVLRIPPAERSAALERMKVDRSVVLAQPIDTPQAP